MIYGLWKLNIKIFYLEAFTMTIKNDMIFIKNLSLHAGMYIGVPI